jgi:hypothetical protein
MFIDKLVVYLELSISFLMVIRILFLSANPYDTQRLQLIEEYNEIDDKLRITNYRDQFDLIQRHAITSEDLVYVMLRYTPQIIHFSGHGSKEALIFQGPQGTTQMIPPKALSGLFKIVNNKKEISCVFLNACFSEVQARAIVEYIDCVIGMTEAVTDNAAKVFATAFYQALGFKKSIKDAFDLGVVQMQLMGITGYQIPQLICKSGVDPARIFVLDEKSRNEIKDSDLVKRTVAENIVSSYEAPDTGSSTSTNSTSSPFDWTVWLPSYFKKG